jgi:hypothetical protein
MEGIVILVGITLKPRPGIWSPVQPVEQSCVTSVYSFLIAHL